MAGLISELLLMGMTEYEATTAARTLYLHIGCMELWAAEAERKRDDEGEALGVC